MSVMKSTVNRKSDTNYHNRRGTEIKPYTFSGNSFGSPQNICVCLTLSTETIYILQGKYALEGLFAYIIKALEKLCFSEFSRTEFSGTKYSGRTFFSFPHYTILTAFVAQSLSTTHWA